MTSSISTPATDKASNRPPAIGHQPIGKLRHRRVVVDPRVVLITTMYGARRR